MVDTRIIIRKINSINHCQARIKKYSIVDFDAFINNEDIIDIVMHNLFIMLQNVIDIGMHIISDEGMEEPDYTSKIAEILGKEKVIRKELVLPMKSMIGLRNIIAHEYGDIDFNIIYKIVNKNLKDIDLFLEDIIRYCNL